MKDFRNLQVWQKAHHLVLAVYRITTGLPKHELYGMTSQLRRAASSIPANIAEGCGRSGDAEFARFLLISMGSASELKYHLLLAKDLKYITEADFSELDNLANEVQKMITALHKRIKSSKPQANR
ncbi:MAG TPA: four helix bundle protein [Anaerolineales bacterium]|nr:four helix bundle protein [Anaerolineales bacterium]HRQ91664.1 four helix bundle protein [Anaerolineales bacterium]